MNQSLSATTAASPPLCMVRWHWADVPAFAPPAGWRLRGYQPGDAAYWERIHRATEHERAVTPTLFAEQFGSDATLLAQRQYYLVHPGGEVVGTATAWFDDAFAGGRWGRVHWVAVLPAYQGQGLGKVLMTAVCGRLRELGHDRAFLRTSAGRIPAINLYLRFGFQPWPRNMSEERLWQRLAPRFKYPLAPR